jgi:hypothetical protein
VEPHERLYGYHRLDDPLLATPDEDGQWLVCKRSQFAEAQAKYNFQKVELPAAPEPYKG